MKVCFKCGEEKALPDFYRHKQMKDGHLNKCIECTKADVRLHRRENDSVREYDRCRSRLPHRVAARAETSKAWRERHPDRYKAQTAVNNAVRDGRLVRLPCEGCGDERSHGHHEDYSRPLDVVWLCARCHARHHAGRRE